MARAAGERLEQPCPNGYHGLKGFRTSWDVDEHDPSCQTCRVRATLAEHTHLHIGNEQCDTVGVGGKPGSMVKCSCGAFHH